jgi:hypothetical protein
MHLSHVYSKHGPPKSSYFNKLGTSIADYCVNITKFGEIERFVGFVRDLFELKEEEDTYVSDDNFD